MLASCLQQTQQQPCLLRGWAAGRRGRQPGAGTLVAPCVALKASCERLEDSGLGKKQAPEVSALSCHPSGFRSTSSLGRSIHSSMLTHNRERRGKHGGGGGGTGQERFSRRDVRRACRLSLSQPSVHFLSDSARILRNQEKERHERVTGAGMRRHTRRRTGDGSGPGHSHQ